LEIWAVIVLDGWGLFLEVDYRLGHLKF
jgi:hypothetical protein